ncbi:prepilin-type N-terminal cleavage/methylation domain-containing protein [Pseudorhodoferax sp.]|uniref:prepilin-type N-terminal cleavage/methylation domain-containing protein n=1 Tax=Pseudorhodoferax sp. TaxID=1993553 RepID=UPI0039E5BBFA
MKPRRAVPPPSAQKGATLVELMVGLAIGLMVVAVALGALLVSRGVSGTVGDASQLQQQAAHALRVIGTQVRQAGSVRLNLAFGKPGEGSEQGVEALDSVAFETSFDRTQDTLGRDASHPLRVGYQNYKEQLHGQEQAQSLLRDCLGRQPSDLAIQSSFRLNRPSGAVSGELECAGADGRTEAVIGNVADFQVRYLLQGLDASGNAVVRRVDAAGVNGEWPSVVAVDVCLELVGDEPLDTASATYRDCNDAETGMGNRLRLVFRNTFQLRAQGAPR